MAGAEGRGGQVDPDQRVGCHVEGGGEVADHGEAVDVAAAAFDLGQPRLRPADQPGQGDLGQSAPAAVGRDPFTDADHDHSLPWTGRAAEPRHGDRDKPGDEVPAGSGPAHGRAGRRR